MKKERGVSLIEFAIVVPTLLLIMAGAVDFGRVFFHAVTLTNAAGTAASYGAHSYIAAGKYTEMQKRAQNDASDLTGMTATAGQQCQCPDGAAVACSALAGATCSGYGTPRAYVRVRTQQQFRSLAPWPGIPDPASIDRFAWMRVR